MLKKDHLELAQHFEELANLLKSQENKEDYIVGIIIASHYSALHYIDSFLFENVKPPETGCPLRHHSVDDPQISRHHIMQKYVEPDICIQYEYLRQKSQDVRYDRAFKYFPAKYPQIEPFVSGALKKIKNFVQKKK